MNSHIYPVYSNKKHQILIDFDNYSVHQNALPWGRGAKSDHETSNAEIGNVESGDKAASESKMAFLRSLDTFYLLNIEH